MDDSAKLAAIYEDLTRTGFVGRYGSAIGVAIAAGLSMIPFIGNPAATIAQGYSDKLTKPDVAARLAELTAIAAEWEPRLAEMTSLAERVSAVEAALRAHPAARSRIEDLLEEVFREVDPVVFFNVGGEQIVRRVTIVDRSLSSSVSGGGTTTHEDIKQSGAAASFLTGPGSKQEINGGYFSRSGGGMSTFSRVGNARLGNGKVQFNVRRPHGSFGATDGSAATADPKDD